MDFVNKFHILKTKKALLKSRGKQDDNLKIEECNKEIDNLCNSIEQYSSFDAQSIGDALRMIVSVYEGEDYIYQQTHSADNKKVCLIVQSELAQNHLLGYDEDYLQALITNNKALVLPTVGDDAIFYNRVDKQSLTYKGPNNFSYVQDFIDKLINYKIKNAEDINWRDLITMQSDFIHSRVDDIKRNYREKEQKNILTCNDKVYCKMLAVISRF